LQIDRALWYYLFKNKGDNKMSYEPKGFTLPTTKIGFGDSVKVNIDPPKTKTFTKPADNPENDEVVYESSVGWMKPNP
jgi:hypothetical protein